MVPARSALPMLATSLAVAAMRAPSRMVFSPTPKQAQTIGPCIRHAVGRLAGQQNAALALFERFGGEQGLGDIPLRALRRGTDEQAEVRAVRPRSRRRDRCRAVRREIPRARRHRRHSRMHEGRASAPGRHCSRAESRRRRDARISPTRSLSGSAAGSLAQQKPGKAIIDARDGGGRRFGFRLSGERIGRRIDQFADARVTRRWCRSSGSARTASRGCWPSLTLTFSTQAAVSASLRARNRHRASPSGMRVVGMDLDEGLRQDARRAAGSGPCASWCATGRGCGRC